LIFKIKKQFNMALITIDIRSPEEWQYEYAWQRRFFP
jgi:hypothetical protein